MNTVFLKIRRWESSRPAKCAQALKEGDVVIVEVEDVLESAIVEKVKTEKDFMRYDAVVSHHHHLYCSETDRIEDYKDEHLDKLISEYFKKKKIKNFKIHDVKLQLTGKFSNKIKQ